jgi:hypothetical protein
VDILGRQKRERVLSHFICVVASGYFRASPVEWISTTAQKTVVILQEGWPRINWEGSWFNNSLSLENVVVQVSIYLGNL